VSAEPDISPQERRARLERSYAASYGVEASDPRIAKLVLADLELVDAVDAAGELRSASPPAYDAERPKPAELADAERETGTRLLDDETRGEPLLSLELDANPTLTSEKWGKAAGRVRRILEGIAGSSDFRVACRNAAMPDLALEYTETYWYFMTRHQLAIVGRNDHNPFRGLSEKDAVKMLVAKVYAICDKSTGKLGWWYVK
jgi:hypothetical protein